MKAAHADASNLVAAIRINLAVEDRAFRGIRRRAELHEHLAGDEGRLARVGRAPVRLRGDRRSGKEKSSGGEEYASRLPRDVSGWGHLSALSGNGGCEGRGKMAARSRPDMSLQKSLMVGQLSDGRWRSSSIAVRIAVSALSVLKLRNAVVCVLSADYGLDGAAPIWRASCDSSADVSCHITAISAWRRLRNSMLRPTVPACAIEAGRRPARTPTATMNATSVTT